MSPQTPQKHKTNRMKPQKTYIIPNGPQKRAHVCQYNNKYQQRNHIHEINTLVKSVNYSNSSGKNSNSQLFKYEI